MGSNLESVNGLSLAIMVLGKAWRIRQLRKHPGIDGYIVDQDGREGMSVGFSKRLRKPS